MKSSLINPDTYDYDELEAILFELTIEWRLENNTEEENHAFNHNPK